MITVKRVKSTVSKSKSHSEPEAWTMSANECDTNVDTCCLVKNFVIFEFTQRAADVYAYINDIAPIAGVPIVSEATAWDDPATGQTYILVVNEGLQHSAESDLS